MSEGSATDILDPGGAVGWRLPPGAACRGFLSPDGSSVLAGSADGALRMLDRGGAEIWRYSARARVEALAGSDDSRLVVAGTWSGEVYAGIHKGVAWKREVSGVVSALAITQEGIVVAGTWAGRVTLFDAEGTPMGQATLHDAVLKLVVHPTGTPVVAALADHSLVALDLDGRECWRKRLDARILSVFALEYHVLVALESGELLWLSAEGSTSQQRHIPGGLERVGISSDGAWLAWVDRDAKLWFSQLSAEDPRNDSVFALSCSGRPDALAVTGAGDGTLLTVALPTGELVTYTRYLSALSRRSSARRVEGVSLSASNTEAVALTRDGSLLHVALSAVKNWLPEPKVVVDLTTPSSLMRSHLGRLVVKLTNEGTRVALRVEVRISGEGLLKEESEMVGTLQQGQVAPVMKSIEPTKAGDVQIRVTVRYEDELKRRFEIIKSAFLTVAEPGPR